MKEPTVYPLHAPYLGVLAFMVTVFGLLMIAVQWPPVIATGMLPLEPNRYGIIRPSIGPLLVGPVLLSVGILALRAFHYARFEIGSTSIREFDYNGRLTAEIRWPEVRAFRYSHTSYNWPNHYVYRLQGPRCCMLIPTSCQRWTYLRADVNRFLPATAELELKPDPRWFL